MPPDCPQRANCCVVICTRNRPRELERSLGSVASQDYPRFEVLVVDNVPSGSQAQEIARRHRARYVVEPRPGVSWARNRGALESHSEIIAYLDDDAIAEPGWLSGLAVEFDDPRVMAVAGRILPLGSHLEQGRMCAAAASIERGLQRRVFDRETPGWFHCANFGAIGIGANMAVRRGAFDLWPGFHVRLGRGTKLPAGEENYAFFELIARGYRVVYTPAAAVHHHAPGSWDELRAEHLRMFTQAGAYLAFLLAEERGYRRATIRFLIEGLRGVHHIQRAPSVVPQRIAPRWREGLAVMRGALIYAGSRAVQWHVPARSAAACEANGRRAELAEIERT